MPKIKGIILAGGTGSRLYPLTIAANKQLLPVYDKPVIYYPLTTLMLAGIRDILIITTTVDLPKLVELLGDGRQWGIQIEYALQPHPKGLPEAFLIGRHFIGDSAVALILGDNFFHGQGLSSKLLELTTEPLTQAHLFAYSVSNPSQYGVICLDNNGAPVRLEEKPENPTSSLAITGLYFYDNAVVDLAATLTPSARGELEITDLNNLYLKRQKIQVHVLGRGFVWFDVGSPSSLSLASNYVQMMQSRQSIAIACPEEVAWRMGYIDNNDLDILCHKLPKSEYSCYIEQLLR